MVLLQPNKLVKLALTIFFIMKAFGVSESALLPTLRKAFPNIKSYEIEHTISQANAEGQRLTILLHEENHDDIEVFLKQVLAADYVNTKKDWADLRRTLLYIRTEIRFYQETMPLLAAKGFHATPHVYHSHHNLQAWLPENEISTAPASEVPPTVYTETLEQQQNLEHDFDDTQKREIGHGVIVMENIPESRYVQESPVTIDQAKLCLRAIAQFHAAAWEDVELLKHAAERLSRASFHLDMRNPKELAGMEKAWEHFATAFQEPLRTAGLTTSSTQHLGQRLKDCSAHISQQISPGPTEPYCTLSHGDYKTMNVFLPRDESEKESSALLVDFASTGIGLGMGDVAMLIHHGVRPNDLDYGGEEALVDFYLDELNDRLKKGDKSYDKDIAIRHYKYCVVDYGRFVLGRFWKLATPDAFAKKKKSKNTTFINRDIDAAVAFVGRMDRYLSEIEKEMNGNKPCEEKEL